MSTALVLGGGISGLSCAYYLSKFSKHAVKKIILAERSTHLGGWIQSTRFEDGTVYEHGPRSVKPAVKAGFNTIDLIDELGLANDVITISNNNPAAQKRYIINNKKLCLLPMNLSMIFKTLPPFSKPVLSYAFMELFRPKKVQDDESVFHFVERRFGKDIANYIFDPMCRGTFAGNAKLLSLRSFSPFFYEAENKHRSVILAMFKGNKDKLIPQQPSKLLNRCLNEKWSMWSLSKGLQLLPDTLVAKLENDKSVQILTQTECNTLEFEKDTGKMKATLGDGKIIEADHIFSCLPAKELAKIINVPSMKEDLSSISAVHVATVTLEFSMASLPYQGFGCLAPSFEDPAVLGIIFDSCCFPAHDGHGATKSRITVMLGGHWFEETLGNVNIVSKSKLTEMAIKAARDYLGIDSPPTNHMCLINKDCIPQYTLGHHSKIDRIKRIIEDTNLPLSLCGASFDGVSLNDCIYNSKLAVQKYSKEKPT